MCPRIAQARRPGTGGTVRSRRGPSPSREGQGGPGARRRDPVQLLEFAQISLGAASPRSRLNRTSPRRPLRLFSEVAFMVHLLVLVTAVRLAVPSPRDGVFAHRLIA